MIRATLDVNVLVSGFPAERGTPAEVIERWANLEYELVLSEHILEGLMRAWQKPYYRLRFGSERVHETLGLLRGEATIVEPSTTVHDIGEDEEDDLVIATAIAGGRGLPRHRRSPPAIARSLSGRDDPLAPPIPRSARTRTSAKPLS